MGLSNARGPGNFFCANSRGCPGGEMVRVGIERDIRKISVVLNLLIPVLDPIIYGIGMK